MALNQDILLNFQGIDNVSNVADQINQSVNGMANGATASTGGLMNTVGRLGSIFQGLNGLVMGVFGSMGLSTFKNMTYGTATAREQIKQLYETVAGSTEDVNSEAAKLWDTMDTLTNHGYVSLDQLGQAINVLGLSTGATVEQMSTLTPVINEIGNRAILMGYDANRTQQLMNNVAQGLNGNTRMLNVAFGITVDKLKAHGWSGQAEDIETYTKALKSYLNISDDVGDHLDNTQGKVISLQKRFRIAGRNLGNYMLPPINAIIDGFTDLNEKSNDLLASLIIVGTGAMSGFASILPTLSPLIQVYQFINDTIDEHNKKKELENQALVVSSSRLKNLKGNVNGVTGALRNYIGVPVYNYLRQVISAHTEWIRTPIISHLNDTDLRLGRLVSRFGELARTAKIRMLAPFEGSLNRVRSLLADATKKIASFIMNYSKLGGQSVAQKMLDKGLDPREFVNPDSKNAKGISTLFKRDRNNKIFEKFQEESKARRINEETKAIVQRNRVYSLYNRQLEASNWLHAQNTEAKIANTIATGDKAVAEGADALATDVDTASQVANTGATEMGLWARIKYTVIKYKDIVATKLGALWTQIMALAEAELLLPILLVIGAIVGLIAIINEMGKQLGWWDNWKEMLDAIVKGLQRLWEAFINNPNVQATIKMFQDAFGELGSGISWVTRQIMQFFGWKDDGSEFDFVRFLIDGFGTLGRIMGDVVNIFKVVFGTIYTIVAPIAGAIWWVLRSIICIIVGCSPGIIPAIQMLRDTFLKIFPYIAMALTGPIGIIVGLFTGLIKGVDITQTIRNLGGKFFTVARHIGLMLWNGLNSVLGGIPQKVWQTFWNMLNNLKRIPQMIWGTAQDIGQQAYNGLDSAVSGLTGGLIHLPGATAGQQTRQNARTMGNATKSYANTNNARRQTNIHVGQGAIQLDARNLTTKESKQIMINALEGLSTLGTVHTKNAKGQK